MEEHCRRSTAVAQPNSTMPSSVTRSRPGRKIFLKMLHLCAFAWLLLATFSAPTPGHAYRQCSFPMGWRGRWFLMGAPGAMVIDASSISLKGPCLEQDGDAYLIKESVNEHTCYRCLVMHQKHENVLQFKQSDCGWSSDLENVCNLLTGDSKLYSMFRIGAVPVKCPFTHSYTFDYNNGGGLCKNPPSLVHSCTDDWRLLFQYMACPDVRGSESMVEEVTCLGYWKEGSNNYLIGISDHRRDNSDHGQYRCYAYAASSNGYKMAKSGEASCHGLFSLTGGATTLRLHKVETRGSHCHFPLKYNEWRALDGKGKLRLRRNTTLRFSGHDGSGLVTYTCHHAMKTLPKSSSKNLYNQGTSRSGYSSSSSRDMGGHDLEYEVAASSQRNEEVLGYFVTTVVHGCTSGYKCLKLLERDHQVLEILMGKLTPVAEEACSEHFFDRNSTDYQTFINSNAESRRCPSIGRYEVVFDGAWAPTPSLDGGAAPQGPGSALALPGSECDAPYNALTIGCSGSDTLEMHSYCSNSEYSCHGWWKDTVGRQFLVVTPTSRASTGARRLCLVIEEHGDPEVGYMTITSSTGYCHRLMNPTPNKHFYMYLNITSSGSCESRTASSTSSGALASRLTAYRTLSWTSLVATILTSSIPLTVCLLSKRQQFY